MRQTRNPNPPPPWTGSGWRRRPDRRQPTAADLAATKARIARRVRESWVHRKHTDGSSKDDPID